MDNENDQEGRSKKKNFKSKTEPVRIRYTHAVLEKYRSEAETLGISLSEYLRKKINNGRVTVRYVDKKYDKLLFELNLVGNNLRQSVKLFYIHGDPLNASESLSKITEDIITLIQDVKRKLSDD